MGQRAETLGEKERNATACNLSGKNGSICPSLKMWFPANLILDKHENEDVLVLKIRVNFQVKLSPNLLQLL